MITVYHPRPRTNARLWLVLALALIVFSMAAALYLQYAVGLDPCPLCVMQRAVILVAAAFLVVALVSAPAWQTLASAAAALFALIAAGIAGWHSWIVAFPPESMSCGRPFEWFNKEFPLSIWLPKLFRGDGDCLATDWSFLGLNVPHLALISFLITAGLAIAALRAANQQRAR